MAFHTYQLAVNGHDGSGNQWVNVFHYLVEAVDATAPTVRIAEALNNAWAADVSGSYLSCLASDVVLRTLATRAVFPQHGGTATASIVGGNVGLRPTATASLNIGPQIAWFPTVDTRSVGKTFLPGVPQGDINEGVISDDLRTLIATLIDVMIPQFSLVTPETGTAQLCVFNKATNAYLAIGTGILRYRLGSQRKRTLPTF